MFTIVNLEDQSHLFFQLILNSFAHNYNIKVKKSMEFLVWVRKRRSTLCVMAKKLFNLHFSKVLYAPSMFVDHCRDD